MEKLQHLSFLLDTGIFLFLFLEMKIKLELKFIFFFFQSMGGAIVTHAASLKKLKIQGISVLDVVEGTAMEALEGYAMINFVSRRPSIFRSYNDAIEWRFFFFFFFFFGIFFNFFFFFFLFFFFFFSFLGILFNILYFLYLLFTC